MSKKFLEGLKRSFRCKCSGIVTLQVEDNVLFGDNEIHEIPFYFFDGFAYCPNYNNKVYMIKNMPMVKYFVEHPTEAKEIMEEFKITETKDITPIMVSAFYGQITEEGDSEEEDLNIDYEAEEKRIEDENSAKEEKSEQEAEKTAELLTNDGMPY